MGATDPVRSALTAAYIQKLLKIKARQLTRRPEFRRTDPADIEHDLICHVLQQAHHFDPTRGCVGTFVARIVDSAIGMMCRHRQRLKRAPGFAAISLENTFVGRCSDKLETPLSDVVQEGHLWRRTKPESPSPQWQAELAGDMADALAALPPQLRAIARRLMQGTENAVARELGISRRQLHKAVDAIRKHLERNGFTKN